MVIAAQLASMRSEPVQGAILLLYRLQGKTSALNVLISGPEAESEAESEAHLLYQVQALCVTRPTLVNSVPKMRGIQRRSWSRLPASGRMLR